MTTSLSKSSISVIPSDGTPTPDQFTFFSRRLKNKLHGEVLRRFLDEKRDRKLTQAELAKRMGKDPAQINRWLSAPKNVEIETISDLLLAMGYVAKVDSVRLADLYRSNHFETSDAVVYRAPKPGNLRNAKVAGSKSGTEAVFQVAAS